MMPGNGWLSPITTRNSDGQSVRHEEDWGRIVRIHDDPPSHPRRCGYASVPTRRMGRCLA